MAQPSTDRRHENAHTSSLTGIATALEKARFAMTAWVGIVPRRLSRLTWSVARNDAVERMDD
jgi:hypothetical protein